MYKIFLVAFIAGAVNGQHYGNEGHGHHDVDYYVEPHYYFEYDVKDPHTKDIKSHKEERKGDHTQGVYSLIEPDGSKRIVEYVVEGKKGGFLPKVHRDSLKHEDKKGHGHGISKANYNYYQGKVQEVTYHSHGQSEGSGHGGQSGGSLGGGYHSQSSYHGSEGGSSGGSIGGGYHSQSSYHGSEGGSSGGSLGGGYHSQSSYHGNDGGSSGGHHSQSSYHGEGGSSGHHTQSSSLGGGYKTENSYEQSSGNQQSYGHGDATSSVKFSTHGAKIYTSTKHIIPQKHGY